MGTRAALGWITNEGKVIATYSQYDGYPTGMGKVLQEQVASWNDIPVERMMAMKQVDASDKPTPEEAALFADVTDKKVSTGDDWYATLRHQQQKIDVILRNGVMTEHNDFIRDSLFCEWAYLFDLRSGEVVILKGFNDKPNRHPDYLEPLVEEGGRMTTYYPCREVWRGTLDAFKLLSMDALQESIDKEEGSEEAA
jgi:hypothetical protein